MHVIPARGKARAHVGRAHGHAPTHEDRENLHRDLDAIETECSRLAAPFPKMTRSRRTQRGEEIPLPELNKTVSVECEEVRSAFEVNLKWQQCSCPSWPNHRSKLKHGDIAVVHMAVAYLQS